jgi:hypothetical protein
MSSHWACSKADADARSAGSSSAALDRSRMRVPAPTAIRPPGRLVKASPENIRSCSTHGTMSEAQPLSLASSQP